ncbi:type II toxin-antitoxin system VapC family toxin [Caldivirga sp.]|uniref:type II toxin-antitoxin system VapC family toxin n=1 Tax=Caldivirga sp. TaxID=2080243 RepID=UPI0025BF18F9|nr:type II toxin-antitoxin system VapC family toxin [Caldivirga sp.]
MTHVIDASSIIRLIELNPANAISIVNNQYTVDLVQYEIGNYLWKLRKLTSINMDTLFNAFNRLLNLLKIIPIGLNYEVLNLAMNTNITYYDAAYVHLAMKLNAKLITEDNELLSKFPTLAVSIEELLH